MAGEARGASPARHGRECGVLEQDRGCPRRDQSDHDRGSFEVAELDLWFNSNDHLPPHFHAEGDGWEVKVFFRRQGDEMFELVWGKKGPSGKLRSGKPR
ncbi:MAG: DUF4160 domain-containing protein [Deltaproteobacteria bacterium]|nr:DUF4160 domain-containing protein [Deltaproteobacteria bacterium]